MVTATKTRRKTKASESSGYDEPPVEEPTDDEEPTPEPQAAGDPGQCGETACWSRTPIVIAHTAAARVVTFTSTWTGPISWNFGDGSSSTSRSPATHTYTAAGTFNVVARPVASSCAGPSAPHAVTVA